MTPPGANATAAGGGLPDPSHRPSSVATAPEAPRVSGQAHDTELPGTSNLGPGQRPTDHDLTGRLCACGESLRGRQTVACSDKCRDILHGRQASLFDVTLPPPPPSRSEQLFDEWLGFHQANPDIYRELRRMALTLVARGRRRYGINGLFEVLRWDRAQLQTTDDEFKINDHHAPFYARLLMMREQRLVGFFALKDEEKYKPLMERLTS